MRWKMEPCTAGQGREGVQLGTEGHGQGRVLREICLSLGRAAKAVCCRAELDRTRLALQGETAEDPAMLQRPGGCGRRCKAGVPGPPQKPALRSRAACLEVQRLARLAGTLLAGAQRALQQGRGERGVQVSGEGEGTARYNAQRALWGGQGEKGWLHVVPVAPTCGPTVRCRGAKPNRCTTSHSHL